MSGKGMVIDAILVPHDASNWKSPSIALGVEFKDPEVIDGRKSSCKLIAQTIDYANTDFDGFGHIPVFCSPSIDWCLRKTGYGDEGVSLAQGILGQENCGELRSSFKSYGMTFLMQSNHRIWSEVGGVADGRRRSLIRKLGSR